MWLRTHQTVCLVFHVPGSITNASHLRKHQPNMPRALKTEKNMALLVQAVEADIDLLKLLQDSHIEEN